VHVWGQTPIVLIHGQLDVSARADFAWHLAHEWPDAELVLVDDAGHGGGHPSTMEAILVATTRFGGPALTALLPAECPRC
jgi:proline iminopeptidase